MCLYFQNEAAKQWQIKRHSTGSNAQSVIDLSSDDDDDIIITHGHVSRHTFSSRKPHTQQRLSSQHQNIELMSINTNEIEILPIDNVEHITEKGSDFGCVQNTITDLPDVVTGLDTSVTLVSSISISHIITESALHEDSQEETLTKDVTPKNVIRNSQDTVEAKPVDNSSGDVNNENVEQVQIHESSLHLVTENDISKSQDNVNLVENSTEAFVNNHSPPVEQENSDWSTLNTAEEITCEEKETDNANCDTSGHSVDDINAEETHEFDKSNEELSINSADNSSSLVIEEITSLTNHERMDEDEGNQEQDEENADIMTTSSRLSHDGDSQDIQPDIVLCEPSMVR